MDQGQKLRRIARMVFGDSRYHNKRDGKRDMAFTTTGRFTSLLGFSGITSVSCCSMRYDTWLEMLENVGIEEMSGDDDAELVRACPALKILRFFESMGSQQHSTSAGTETTDAHRASITIQYL